MVYSKEEIVLANKSWELTLYLKKTRNLSYRIYPNRISFTIPQFYRTEASIQEQKKTLLSMVSERLSQEPKLASSVDLFHRSHLQIYTDTYELIKEPIQPRFIWNEGEKRIYLSQNKSINKAKIVKKVIEKYTQKIERRVRYINSITVKKNLNIVELKNNQSSWGLCSSKDEITISVNTLFAPLWVLDYVIVHELCHLVHHNHSSEFWDLVSKYYPKYRLAKRYLKEKGHEFVF